MLNECNQACKTCSNFAWIKDLDKKVAETCLEMVALQSQVKTLSDDVQAGTRATNQLLKIVQQVEGGKNLIKGV